MIQVLYDYNTEYTKTIACYDVDINNIGKTWSSFNFRSHGLTVMMDASQSKGRVRIPLWARIVHFVILASAPCSSRKPMQMKLTMTYNWSLSTSAS